MESKKLTYAEVLKNQSGYLNAGMEPRPLIRKAPKVRLSEEALTKLRAAFKDESTAKPTSVAKKPKRTESKPKATTQQLATNTAQPVMLATASEWIVPGSVISDRTIASGVKSSFAEVRVLKSEEIGSVVREGGMENPIDLCDEYDEAELKCDEKLSKCDEYSVDGMSAMIDASDFDADAAFVNGFEIFDSTNKPREEKTSELETSLRLDTTDELRRAKRKMENSFKNDYSAKMKPFKRVDRPEYEGEYTFIVRVVVDDSNTVEIKDTVTYCKLRKVSDESEKSEEEEYKPESDAESISTIDEKEVIRTEKLCFLTPRSK